MNKLKPYFSLLFLLVSVLSYGQRSGKIMEIGMGYGHFSEIGLTNINKANISEQTGISFGESYNKTNCFTHSRIVRSYDFSGAVRINQSNNLRNEIYLGARIAGQFQHRTIFYGSMETVEEEYTDPVRPNRVRQLSSYNAVYLAEINDYLFVGPSVYNRFIINDNFSAQLNLNAGTLIPIRSGYQSSNFSGTIDRVLNDGQVESENWNYDNEIDYSWISHNYEPRFRVQSEVSLEWKPFNRKPYYFNSAYLIGRSIENVPIESYTYHGFRIGIVSQF